MVKSLHINEALHGRMKRYCQKRGIKMSRFLPVAIKKFEHDFTNGKALKFDDWVQSDDGVSLKSVVIPEACHDIIVRCCDGTIKLKSFLEQAIHTYLNEKDDDIRA